MRPHHGPMSLSVRSGEGLSQRGELPMTATFRSKLPSAATSRACSLDLSVCTPSGNPRPPVAQRRRSACGSWVWVGTWSEDAAAESDALTVCELGT
jgi:hypothetical protein